MAGRRTILALLLAMAAAPAAGRAGECERYLREESVARLLEAGAATARADVMRWAATVFFDSLPDSFSCYKAVFDDPGPLAEKPAMDEVLPRVRAAVPQRSYIRKLVRLSVGAAWATGQIDHLQKALRAALEDSPSAFVPELAGLDARQETSVWDFLFAGPDPAARPLSAGLQQRLCTLSARSCQSAAAAHARALEKDRGAR